MQTISDLWWLWGIILLISGSYTLYNQITRMKRMTSRNISNGANSLMDGVGKMAVGAFVTWISIILLAIAVVVNITR